MSQPSPGAGPARRCESCGQEFVPKLPHYRTCPRCFQKGAPGGPPGGATAIPPDYLAQGYFRDPGRAILFPELLTTLADAWAGEMARANVSMGQLRRYFTMARSLQGRLDANHHFDAIANELRRMKANVAAVVGRIQERHHRAGLERTLKQFIDRNVDAAVRDEASFRKGFLQHFECVLAYFYWHASQKGGPRRGA